MHELGITQNIVTIAIDHASGAKVQRVVIEVGKLAAILPEAIQFCFDICSQGTIVEGAQLQIIEVPGLARCRVCGTEMEVDMLFGVCTCGSTDLQVLQGEELKITALEIEEPETEALEDQEELENKEVCV